MEASQTGPENTGVDPAAPTQEDEETRRLAGGHKLAAPTQDTSPGQSGDPHGQGGGTPLQPAGHKLATEAPASGAPDAPAAERGLGGPSAAPGVAEGDRDAVEMEAVPTGADEVPSEEERNPAREQAPVASDAQDAIIGDPGLREQQPFGNEGSPTAVDRPVATSAPPPSAQSGVPLPEDRAAGIEPGVKGPVVPVREDAEGEIPEHDASEGQTITPPQGG